MLARFGYDCPAVGFAFDIGRTLSVMTAQGVDVAPAGPDFFIIDFTREKTAALSLARRLRDHGASVARDIVSRGLDESLAYARAHRVRTALVIGAEGSGVGDVVIIDLGDGSERVMTVSAVLATPEVLHPGRGGRS